MLALRRLQLLLRAVTERPLLSGGLLAILLCTASALRSQAAKTTDASPPQGTSLTVVTGGILGSALGTLAGVAGGDWAGRSLNVEQGGEDPGLGPRVIGGLIGSLTGTMLGTTAASGLTHRRPVSLGGRMRDAGVGMLIGIFVGLVVTYGADDQRTGLVAFSLTQGVVAGLSNGRW
jgi:hypothetical protein